MAKIRGFKPDLWTDEDFVELSPFARLLWLGMWSYACDNGHLADKSKQIKMRVLPTDDVNCAELLRELEESGRILRSNGVITIPNFRKHQKPDKRYFQTCDLVPDCAKPGDSQRETRGGHVEPTTSAPSGHTVGSWGPHVDGDGEVMVKGSDGEGSAAGKPAKRAAALPDTWQPNDRHRVIALEEGRNLDREIANFRDDAAAKGRVAKDWDAAFRNWLRSPYGIRDQRPAPVRALPEAHDLELPPDGLSPAEYAAWDRERRERRARA